MIFKEKAIDTKCLYAFCRGYTDTFNHRVKHEKIDVHKKNCVNTMTDGRRLQRHT